MPEEKNSEHPGLSDSMRMEAITFAPTVTGSGHRIGKMVAHSCRIIEVVAVVVTCIYLAKQTGTMATQTQSMVQQSEIMANQSKIMADQERENRLTNKLAVASLLRDHYQTINKVLAEHHEARKEFGLNIQQVLGYMLITDYDNIYQMRAENLIDKGKWPILEPFMRQTMMEQLNIRDLWSAPGNRGRSPNFKDYVEACVYSDTEYSLATPMNPGIVGITMSGLTPERRKEIQDKDCPERSLNDKQDGARP